MTDCAESASPVATVVVLTGGTSTRLGQDKASTLIGDRTMLDHVLQAVPVGCPIVVVGPEVAITDPRVQFTQEQPPGGGPVAGILAGIDLAATQLIGVVAADMPFSVPVLLRLMRTHRDLDREVAAIIPVDGNQRTQPLCASYRRAALESARQEAGLGAGASMRQLVASLTVQEELVCGEELGLLFDIDTPAELAAAEATILGDEGR